LVNAECEKEEKEKKGEIREVRRKAREKGAERQYLCSRVRQRTVIMHIQHPSGVAATFLK
jgi:hypothetical protein